MKQVFEVTKDAEGKTHTLNLKKIKTVTLKEFVTSTLGESEVRHSLAANALTGQLDKGIVALVFEEKVALQLYHDTHGKNMPNDHDIRLKLGAKALWKATRKAGQKLSDKDAAGVCSSDLSAIRFVCEATVDEIKAGWAWVFADLKVVQDSSLSVQNLKKGAKKVAGNIKPRDPQAPDTPTVSADAETAKKAQTALLGVRGEVCAVYEGLPAGWVDDYPEEFKAFTALYAKCKKG